MGFWKVVPGLQRFALTTRLIWTNGKNSKSKGYSVDLVPTIRFLVTDPQWNAAWRAKWFNRTQFFFTKHFSDAKILDTFSMQNLEMFKSFTFRNVLRGQQGFPSVVLAVNIVPCSSLFLKFSNFQFFRVPTLPSFIFAFREYSFIISSFPVLFIDWLVFVPPQMSPNIFIHQVVILFVVFFDTIPHIVWHLWRHFVRHNGLTFLLTPGTNFFFFHKLSIFLKSGKISTFFPEIGQVYFRMSWVCLYSPVSPFFARSHVSHQNFWNRTTNHVRSRMSGRGDVQSQKCWENRQKTWVRDPQGLWSDSCDAQRLRGYSPSACSAPNPHPLL